MRKKMIVNQLNRRELYRLASTRQLRFAGSRQKEPNAL
jgi:hypothetical protein